MFVFVMGAISLPAPVFFPLEPTEVERRHLVCITVGLQRRKLMVVSWLMGLLDARRGRKRFHVSVRLSQE